MAQPSLDFTLCRTTILEAFPNVKHDLSCSKDLEGVDGAAAFIP